MYSPGRPYIVVAPVVTSWAVAGQRMVFFHMFLQARVTLEAFPIVSPRGRSSKFPWRGITILYLQQSECVCVCVSMRAVYLVLLNLSFLRMSVCVCVCVCLYAYCLLSIFKPFISVCVCVCVYVTERETVLMNYPLWMCSIVSPAFHIGLPGVSNPAPGELPSYRL